LGQRGKRVTAGLGFLHTGEKGGKIRIRVKKAKIIKMVAEEKKDLLKWEARRPPAYRATSVNGRPRKTIGGDIRVTQKRDS